MAIDTELILEKYRQRRVTIIIGLRIKKVECRSSNHAIRISGVSALRNLEVQVLCDRGI